MNFDLQTRDLKTGNTSSKTFESVEESLTWLKDRPNYVDVMGIASHHVPLDISEQLKAAMRPLDDEEKALDATHKAARDRPLKRPRKRARTINDIRAPSTLTPLGDRPIGVPHTRMRSLQRAHCVEHARSGGCGQA